MMLNNPNAMYVFVGIIVIVFIFQMYQQNGLSHDVSVLKKKVKKMQMPQNSVQTQKSKPLRKNVPENDDELLDDENSIQEDSYMDPTDSYE
jgi:hypothetical protein